MAEPKIVPAAPGSAVPDGGSFGLGWAPPPSLARHVDLVWARRSGLAEPLVPDAAVELVWSGRGLFVRGADTHAHCVGSFPDRTFVGVRFRPGAAATVLGLGGADLADARVGISELWGRLEMERLEALLSVSASPARAAGVLVLAVEARACHPPDEAVAALVDELRTPRLREPLGDLSARLGLSERQLRRRCVAALGYGPRVLYRILRFQRFRALARMRPEHGLAALAVRAGYADQAHLTRECVRCAGETPAAHLARLRHVRSVQDAGVTQPYRRDQEVWRR